MIPGLEEMLTAHMRQHNFERVDIGASNMDGFVATVWWERIGCEIACATGSGASVAAAVGNALDRADEIRADATSFRLKTTGAVA